MNEAPDTFQLDLNPDEAQLVRTALEMLEDTLGHDEADELAEVQALLRRLRDGPGSS
jgi:hypothetical protein